jgi:hypothetical protein
MANRPGQQPPPIRQQTVEEPAEDVSAEEFLPLPYDYLSPSLRHLDVGRRPSSHTLCERCRNSVWVATPSDLRAYCRVLFKDMWSLADKQIILACDGALLGQEDDEEAEGR